MCSCVKHRQRRRCSPGWGKRGEEGILLLEALIGLAIIGIVTISLLAATGAQVRLADKADVLLTAAALAQDRLAAIQFMDDEGFNSPPDSLLAGSFPAPFDEYSWNAEVEEAEGEYDLFAVRVVVEGRGESLPFETLIHRPTMTGNIATGAVTGVSGGMAMGGRTGQGRGAARGGGRGARGGREMMGLGGMGRGRMGRGGMGRGGSGRGDTGRAGQQGTGRPPPGQQGTGGPPPRQQGTGRPPPGTSQPPPPPVGLYDSSPEGDPL